MIGFMPNVISDKTLLRSPVEKDLSAFQNEIIGELVNNTLTEAVKLMERMLKIRINANNINYGNGSLPPISEFDALGRFKVHLVRVSFEGDVKGAFYFIINSHEVELINRVCLPQEMNPEKRTETKMMQHGFMSEIENIIASQSAATISEYLGVQIIGEVPKVEIISGSDVNQYLKEENVRLKTAFHVSSTLSGVVVNVAPYFIWMLDESFLDMLKLNS